jgi:voltage-gated potassium channel
VDLSRVGLAGEFTSIMVLIVVPLITAHFAGKLIVDHDAFQHDEQEELKQNLRHVRRLLEELAAREGISVEGSAAPPAAPADR